MTILDKSERRLVARLGFLEVVAAKRAGLFRWGVIAQVAFIVGVLTYSRTYEQHAAVAATTRTVHVAIAPQLSAMVPGLRAELAREGGVTDIAVATDPVADVRLAHADLGIVSAQPWRLAVDEHRLSGRVALGRVEAAIDATPSVTVVHQDLDDTRTGRLVPLAGLAGLLVISLGSDVFGPAATAFADGSRGTKAESILVLPMRRRVPVLSKLIGVLPRLGVDLAVVTALAALAGPLLSHGVPARGFAVALGAVTCSALTLVGFGAVLGVVCRTSRQLGIASAVAVGPLVLLAALLLTTPVRQAGPLAFIPIIGAEVIAREGMLQTPTTLALAAMAAVASLALLTGVAVAAVIMDRTDRVFRPA